MSSQIQDSVTLPQLVAGYTSTDQRIRVPVLQRIHQEGPHLSPGPGSGGGGARHEEPHHGGTHLHLPRPAGTGQKGYGTVRHAARPVGPFPRWFARQGNPAPGRRGQPFDHPQPPLRFARKGPAGRVFLASWSCWKTATRIPDPGSSRFPARSPPTTNGSPSRRRNSGRSSVRISRGARGHDVPHPQEAEAARWPCWSIS